VLKIFSDCERNTLSSLFFNCFQLISETAVVVLRLDEKKA
jgi:hypothetical protein